MYDIFISYRRKHGFAFAKMISELLKSHGVSAFVDLDELRSGTFDDKIIDAISATPAFVLILTPGALDRCGEKDDWLTREITAAIETGRIIIPFMCDGFEWPKQWGNDIPEKIRLLSNYNSVAMSYDYVDAMINKIIGYAKGEATDSQDNGKRSVQEVSTNDIDSFFRKAILTIDDIDGVDLAFHAGSVWHQNIERLEILGALADAGKKIRVIVNTPEVADSASRYMRHKLKRYIAFDEAIALWKNFESLYENVEVRISDIPLMRIYYSFNMVNPENNMTRVKFYTHGNSRIDLNFAQNFNVSDAAYKLFRDEFEFLWKNAKNN